MTDAPAFQQAQRQLTDFLREPASHAGPQGVEPRRLKIYQELFFNNIEGFLSGGFPVLHSLYRQEDWLALVRRFMVDHQCETPYFLAISQEFLGYLQTGFTPRAVDPPFMVELAHYEWVELVLDVAEQDIDQLAVDREADLLTGKPVKSPLAWCLAYQYPVHQLGPNYQPQQPPAQPTYLVVYRDRQDEVRFMELNAVSARLLELVDDDSIDSGRALLQQLAQELGHPNPQQVIDSGLSLLQQFRDRDIVLGVNPGL